MNSDQTKVDRETPPATVVSKNTADKHDRKRSVMTSNSVVKSDGLSNQNNERVASAKQDTQVDANTTLTTDTSFDSAVTSSIATIASSSSVNATSVAKGAKLTYSDSGIDSTITDVYSNNKRILPSTQTPFSRRNSASHQVTNDSMSESVTSGDANRAENLSRTNLYIRGLSPTTTDADIYDMCIKYGAIVSTKAIFDKTTGCCRGYGFVQYTTPQSAELAVSELTKLDILAQMARLPTAHPNHNQHYSHHHHHQHYHHDNNHHHHHHQHSNQFNHNDHQFHYNRSNGSNNHSAGNMNANNQLHIQDNNGNQHNNQNNSDPTNLYIANLPLTMNEDELEILLSSYGPVISTRILRDERKMTRGVGFARMETREKCQEVIDELNGKSCKGSTEPLLVKFADGGNRKRHNNQNHHHSNNHVQHHHKYSQEDNRWRDSAQGGESNNQSNFEQHGSVTHNNHMPDLAMMNSMGYPRMPPPFSPNMAHGPGYPSALASQSGPPHWVHPGQPWNVIPHQMISAASLGSHNQVSPAPAAYPYAQLPHLTSQMQGLQIAHHTAHVSGGYLPPHHHWSPVWPTPVPHQHHPVGMEAPQQVATGQQQHQTSPRQTLEPTPLLVNGSNVSQDFQQKQSANISND